MPIKFDPNLIEAFFGSKIIRPEPEFDVATESLDYAGKMLRYSIVICDSDELISISGDPEVPFGADSFFEISVPCDSIALAGDGYYPDQKALHFWYGDPEQRHNLMMMLLKRPDGDLKVWPACPWPSRHPLHRICWGDSESEPYAQ